MQKMNWSYTGEHSRAPTQISDAALLLHVMVLVGQFRIQICVGELYWDNDIHHSSAMTLKSVAVTVGAGYCSGMPLNSRPYVVKPAHAMPNVTLGLAISLVHIYILHYIFCSSALPRSSNSCPLSHTLSDRNHH